MSLVQIATDLEHVFNHYYNLPISGIIEELKHLVMSIASSSSEMTGAYALLFAAWLGGKLIFFACDKATDIHIGERKTITLEYRNSSQLGDELMKLPPSQFNELQEALRERTKNSPSRD